MPLDAFTKNYIDLIPENCFDVGFDTEIKTQQTLWEQLPVWVQGAPDPIHLFDES